MQAFKLACLAYAPGSVVYRGKLSIFTSTYVSIKYMNRKMLQERRAKKHDWLHTRRMQLIDYSVIAIRRERINAEKIF